MPAYRQLFQLIYAVPLAGRKVRMNPSIRPSFPVRARDDIRAEILDRTDEKRNFLSRALGSADVRRCK